MFNKILKISSLAVTFSLLSYFYSYKSYILSHEFESSLQINLNSIRSNLSQGIIFIPDVVLPFIFWFLIGVIAYFIYFTLQVVYNDTADNIYQKLYYTGGQKEDIEVSIKKAKRLTIHALIIIAYVALIVICFLLIPIAETIRVTSQNYILATFRNPEMSFGLGLIASFIFWFLFLSTIYRLYTLVQNIEHTQKIEEEHFET